MSMRGWMSASSTLYIVVLREIASASERTATAENTGCLRSVRTAIRMSCLESRIYAPHSAQRFPTIDERGDWRNGGTTFAFWEGVSQRGIHADQTDSDHRDRGSARRGAPW